MAIKPVNTKGKNMSSAFIQTEQYLKELKLQGLQKNLNIRVKQAQDESLAYEEFLNIILFDEILHKNNVKIERLIKAANFKKPASMENIDFITPRGLDKKQIREFALSSFIGNNLIITGATGAGKTYIASAVGHSACLNGFSVMFFKMNLLLEKLAIARLQNSYLNLIKKLAATHVLIIDDFGIKPMTSTQFQDFYDIIDERDDCRSTIVTTQVPVENWNEIISDQVVCEAITDRIASRAIKININVNNQETYREKMYREKNNEVKNRQKTKNTL